MRKLVVTEFVTLDGVVEEPQNWSFSYYDKALELIEQRLIWSIEEIYRSLDKFVEHTKTTSSIWKPFCCQNINVMPA